MNSIDVYQNFESDSSDSSRSSKSSKSDDHLSLQYGMEESASEHSRDFQDVNVGSKRMDAEGEYPSDQSSTEPEEYDDEDIRSITKKKGMMARFDWTVLKQKRNLYNIGYTLAGLIAFILVVSLSVGASKKKKAKKAAAVPLSPLVDPPGTYDEGTYVPTIEATYSETFSGTVSGTSEYTVEPSTYWWNEAFDDDGLGNSTEVPFSGTDYPIWEDNGWWHTWEPTVWTGTLAPEDKQALIEAEAAAKAAEDEAKRAEEAMLSAEDRAKLAEEQAKAAEDAAKVKEQALEDQKNMLIPGWQRPNGELPTTPPTLPPTKAPTIAPTVSPAPTATPTTGAPTTLAPVHWYVGMDLTFAPTTWTETTTWAPTTWLPTQEVVVNGTIAEGDVGLEKQGAE